MRNTGVLTIKLPRHLSAKVARSAKKRRISKSQVVREALEIMHEDGPTLGDLCGDLFGIKKDGPTDLSTNPKHLKGFGR